MITMTTPHPMVSKFLGITEPTKWWSINGSFDLFSQTQQGITESLAGNSATATVDDITVETVEVDNVCWNLSMNNSLKVSKNLTIPGLRIL